MITNTFKKRFPFALLLVTTGLQFAARLSVSGQVSQKGRDTVWYCGGDAARQVLKARNPDFDKQLQAHEKIVQEKLAKKEKDAVNQQPKPVKKSGKKTKQQKLTQ